MRPDLQTYLPYVEEFDVTEEQKAELIHTVWWIMESFVDRAFGLDPVQQASAPLALPDSREPPGRLLSEGDSFTHQFQDAGVTAGEGRT